MCYIGVINIKIDGILHVWEIQIDADKNYQTINEEWKTWGIL